MPTSYKPKREVNINVYKVFMAPTDTKQNAPADLCPCGRGNWDDLERIKRETWLKILLFWLPFKRYKCYKCQRKKLVLSQ